MIKRFTASQVNASEAGDYFQIHFEEGLGDNTQYLLIQRQFEDYDEGECYVEDDELLMVDQYKILEVKLTRTYFEILYRVRLLFFKEKLLIILYINQRR